MTARGGAPDTKPAGPDARAAARVLEETLRRLPGPPARALVTLPAPVAPPERLLRVDPTGPGLLWSPAEGPQWAGVGETWRRPLSGPNRFDELDGAARTLCGEITLCPHAAAQDPTPSLFGGFAFRPGAADDPDWVGFGDGLFVLPRWTYRVHGDHAQLAVALAGPEDFRRGDFLLRQFAAIWETLTDAGPSAPDVVGPVEVRETTTCGEWTALVRRAQQEIAAGRLRKVVLARRTLLAAAAPFDPAAVAERLRALHPATHLFAFRPAGRSVFAGASPELLLARRGGAVETEALAGTIPRRPGEARAVDEALAQRLAASAKDLAEHELVVDGIRRALAPFCSTLSAAGAPRIRALTDVLHLSTPICGTLSGACSLPRLVAALHPTPATGGVPREAALAFLGTEEPFARGWYASPVGRLGADGDGEFCVAIRSALLRGAEATLFAGAGIVAASDPDAEFAELAAKERAVRAALEV